MPFSAVGVHNAYAALISVLLAVRGYRKQSLSFSGAVVAFGAGTFIASCGAASCASLLTFYVTGSYLSKRGGAVKAKIERDYNPKGARRSHWQVVCNAGPAMAIAAIAVLTNHGELRDKRWFLAIIGQLAAMQGDTWSSEIGVLSSRLPRLLIGFREVPRGTNGAVSLLGFAAAVASGVVSAVVVAATAQIFPAGGAGATAREIVITSLLSAVGGSIVDSVLGQFFQQSVQSPSGHIIDGFEKSDDEGRVLSGRWNLLSNNGVNAVTGWLVCVSIVHWFS